MINYSAHDLALNKKAITSRYSLLLEGNNNQGPAIENWNAHAAYYYQESLDWSDPSAPILT
jgi:hypothetical protein